MENSKLNKASRTQKMVLCALFAALIAVGAFIKIPISVVPITLQVLFTMMSGLLLGGRLGALSVCLYAAIGLAGVPVFAGGGGIGYILQPTFGYIIGFAAGAYVTGEIANKSDQYSFLRILTANLTGLAIIYVVGIIYYYVICNFYLGTAIGIRAVLFYGFVLPIPGDIILSICTALVARRLLPEVRRYML